MRKLFTFLSVLIFVLYLCTMIGYAQTTEKTKEVIIIEIKVLSGDGYDKWEIPINRTPKSKIGAGGVSIYECGGCMTEAEWANAKYSTYSFSARAFRMGTAKANVGFDIFVDDECKTRKTFKVVKNRKTELNLSCGVKILAYYGFEGNTVAEESDSTQ